MSLHSGPAPAGPFDVADRRRRRGRRGDRPGAGALRRCACVLVEAGPDVGAGTSKANTAHPAHRLRRQAGHARGPARRAAATSCSATTPTQVGIPLERTGALLVAWDDEQLAALPGDRRAAPPRNGYTAIRAVGADELYRREPHLGPGALGALEVPDEAIICPFTTAAGVRHRGRARAAAQLRRDTPVTGRRARRTRRFDVRHLRAAALSAPATSSTPPACAATRSTGCWATTASPSRRGAASCSSSTSSPAPLVSTTSCCRCRPRRPRASSSPRRSSATSCSARRPTTSTTRTTPASTAEGLAYLRAEGGADPARAARPRGHRRLRGPARRHRARRLPARRPRRTSGYVCVGGIRSTGLSALDGDRRARPRRARRRGPRARAEPDAGRRRSDAEPRRGLPAAVRAGRADRGRPRYGRIVCFCERVTRGEIRDALASPIPPVDLDGLRRRTRALMGRCQGFFCGAAGRGAAGRGRGTSAP